MSFVDKELSKVIMTRNKFCNNFLQSKSEQNRKIYAKQINFCVSLLRKISSINYENSNERSVFDMTLLEDSRTFLV